MKKLLAILAALCLCTAVLPALGAGLPYDSVLRIYAIQEAGDVLVGTAVSMTEQSLVTVKGAAAVDANLYVMAADGTRITIDDAMELDSELMLLLIQEKITPVSAAGDGSWEGLVTVLTASTGGASAVSGRIATTVKWRGLTSPLLKADAPVLPGSAVLDGQGRLLGLTAAEWTAAPQTYVVLSMDGIRASLSNRNAASSTSYWVAEGMQVTAEKGMITVDLSAFMSGKSGECTVYVEEEHNPYYSYTSTPVDGETALYRFHALPGKVYTVRAWYTEDKRNPQSVNQEQGVTVSIPDAPAYAAYGYEDKEYYLGLLPAGTDESDPSQAVPVPAVTRTILADESQMLFLQASTVYQVTEEVSYDMLISLETPEGWSFLTGGGFYLDPTLQTEDIWHCDLSGLLKEYLSYTGDYASGAYVVTVFYDGMKVNQIGFTLE